MSADIRARAPHRIANKMSATVFLLCHKVPVVVMLRWRHAFRLNRANGLDGRGSSVRLCGSWSILYAFRLLLPLLALIIDFPNRCLDIVVHLTNRQEPMPRLSVQKAQEGS